MPSASAARTSISAAGPTRRSSRAIPTPARSRISAGGVTRNICDNLARLGADVKLVSAVGDDLFAQIICEQSAQAGIDVSHIYHTPGRSSSMYLAILDNSGDMHVAFRICTCCKIFRWTILGASGS